MLGIHSTVHVLPTASWILLVKSYCSKFLLMNGFVVGAESEWKSQLKSTWRDMDVCWIAKWFSRIAIVSDYMQFVLIVREGSCAR